MKKLLILIFCALLALLWACSAPASSPTAAPTAAPAPEAASAPAETPAPTAAPTAEPTPEPTRSPEELKAIAEGYIDEPVEELFKAIGKPQSSDYAPSCLGDGEDGNLYYDGFTVYTYRENGEETVSYVE
jgi:hypothetical protein